MQMEEVVAALCTLIGVGGFQVGQRQHDGLHRAIPIGVFGAEGHLYLLVVAMIFQPVGHHTQLLSRAKDNHLIVCAQVGILVVNQVLAARHSLASPHVLVHPPSHSDIVARGLRGGRVAIPLLEHVGRQLHPVVGYFEVISIDVNIRHDLLQHPLGAIRKILGEQTVALVHVVDVGGEHLVGGLIAVHIATIVAPTGRLGIDGRLDGVIEAVPQLDDRLLAQGAIVGQQFLGTVQVAAGKLGVLQQVVEDARGEAATIQLRQHIVVLAQEDGLGVPAQETEPLAVGTFAAQGIPVVVVPVGIAAILVDEHVVDEAVDVEQWLQRRVVVAVGSLALQ